MNRTFDALERKRRGASFLIRSVCALAGALVPACSNSDAPEQLAQRYVAAIAERRDVSASELAGIPDAVAEASPTSVEIPAGRTIRKLDEKSRSFVGPGAHPELGAHAFAMQVGGAKYDNAVYYVVTFTATLDDDSTREFVVALRPRADRTWGVVRKPAPGGK